MDRHRACELLDLAPTGWTHEDVKRQYRRQALLHHPDKNPSPGATERFQEIHLAYEFLSTEEDSSFFCFSYQSLLFEYLASILSDRTHVLHVFFSIAERLTTRCEQRALDVLERMDKKLFLALYTWLHKFRDVLFVSDEWIAKLEALKQKHQKDEDPPQVMTLHPTLDDLYADNVYRLLRPLASDASACIYVPLWHHELVYDDQTAGELVVRCVPSLPAHVEVDESNDVHVHVQREKASMWDHDELTFQLCTKKAIRLPRDQVRMTELQTIRLRGEGIARPHPHLVFEVSKRSDILVHLRMT